MRHIIHLDNTHRTALLEGVAFLSRCYWGSDAELSRDVLQGNYLKPFEALKPMVNYEPPVVIEELKAINATVTDEDEIFQSLEQAYVQLFINSRDGIIAPLYASCYAAGSAPGKDAALMGPPAISMKERFESKGLSLGEHIQDPPDHLAIELEYLFFLLEKGWSGNDPALSDEAGSFAAEIMLPWVVQFKDRLVAVETQCRFYQLITALLCAVLRFISASDAA